MAEMAESRRGLLKKTLGGAVLLAAAGAVPVALRKTAVSAGAVGRQLLFFTAAEYSIVAAVAERVLAQPEGELQGELALPGEIAAQVRTQAAPPAAAALDVAGRVDAFLAPVHESQAAELKQLLALFDNGLFSLLGGGPATNFTRMSPEQQDAHLARWAGSRLAVQRTGYQVLKRLCCAMYYAAPQGFAAVGYPGPPYELVKTVNEARAQEAAGKGGAR